MARKASQVTYARAVRAAVLLAALRSGVLTHSPAACSAAAQRAFSSLTNRPRNEFEFPFLMAIALRLGAGFLCEDEPGAETLELTVSRFLTPT